MTDDQSGAVGENSVVGLEVRVHGVGSHGDLSSLGTPILVRRSSNGQVVVVEAPAPATHRIQMLNWSRVTRTSKYGVLWWAVFPFTLLNASGFMVSDSRGQNVHRAVVSVFASVLTATYAVWLVALIETVTTLLGSGFALVVKWVALAGLLLAVVVNGIIRRPASRVGPLAQQDKASAVHGCIQAAAIAGVSYLTFISKPGQRWFLPDALHGSILSVCWSFTGESAIGCLNTAGNRIDFLALVVLATTLVPALLLVLTAILSYPWQTRFRSWLRLWVAVFASLFLANVIFASVRTALSWLHSWILRLFPTWGISCVGSCFDEVSADMSLLPYSAGSGWYAMDLLPVVVPWSILVVLLIFTLPKVVLGQPASFRTCRRRAEAMNSWFTGLPDSLRGFALLLPILIGAATFLLFWIGTNRPPVRDATWFEALREASVLIAIDGLALLLPLGVLAVMLIPPVRAFTNVVADVVGYWPRRLVALCGTSYTDDVLAELNPFIEAPRNNRPVALVGHSQGSVLCYTLLRRETQSDWTNLSLVTCGSPLKSLYVAFFPRFFSQAEFSELVQQLGGRWLNFWRSTDPIASTLFENVVTPIIGSLEGEGLAYDNELAEGAFNYLAKLNRHSNYWTEPLQRKGIEFLMGQS